MPTSYTITQVAANPREWSSQHGGTFLAYQIGMKDPQGAELTNVEWSRKKDSPAPTVGETVEGDIETKTIEGANGPWEKRKFKKAAGGFGGGGGFRGKSPEERRSIAMQHAQKCAVTILETAAAHGDYKPPSAGDVVGQVKTVAEALFQQVIAAEKGTG